MITPAISLGAYGNFIEWQAKSHDASYPDDYMLLVSTTDNQISSFTDTIYTVIGENFEWTTRQISLSANGYNSETVYLAFVNNTEDGFILYLDDLHAWKEDPVSVNEISAAIQVNIYPNPTAEIVNVETAAQLIQIELLSLNGDVMLSSKNSSLNLSNYPVGVYFLRVVTGEGIVVKRIIKN